MNTSIGKWNQWSLNDSKINLFLNNINADERNSIWNGIFILRIQCTLIDPSKKNEERKKTDKQSFRNVGILQNCK